MTTKLCLVPIVIAVASVLSFSPLADAQAPSKDKAAQAPETHTDDPTATFSFGGAVWLNYAYQDWKSPDEGKKRDLRFDNVRLTLDGTYGEQLLFSAQYRFYSYTRTVHHAWFGYRSNESNQVELGVTQVPFGLLPFATHSFWFGLGYYLGIEDDYDAGVKWHRTKGPWDLHFAYFINEELGDATNLDRFSTDIVRQGDQQNEEIHQVNLRVVRTFAADNENSSELGLSAQYGQLDNLLTQRTGDHWHAAVHYAGRYGDWNPELQVTSYEYNPENPANVDDRLVLMGNLTSTRLVAAEGTLINANLRHFWDINWGPFTKLNAYLNYSHLFKEEHAFSDSQLINPGGVVQAGPLWIWVDVLVGKNAWYLNDSPGNSGMGAGGSDDWEYRFNVSLEWYF